VEAVQALYGKKTDGDVTTTSTTRRPAAAKPNGGDGIVSSKHVANLYLFYDYELR
jgi:hypothetical protein